MQDTITGSGQLKISGEPMGISFTVPRGQCLPETLLPDVQRFANQLTDMAVARVEAMPAAQAAEVRARFQSAREVVAASGLPPHGPAEGDQAAYRSFGIAYFALGVPCPFLVEESCSIHPDRPLVCREYLVTSPPAACGTLGSGQVKQIPVPSRVWAVFSRSTSVDGGLAWMPLIEVLDYVDANPAPEPVRTGPEHVEALLKELAK